MSAVTNASRTNLMDLSTLNWHAPFLELFKAPPGIMPRIVSNAEVYGRVAEGPLKHVPIAGEGAGYPYGLHVSVQAAALVNISAAI
jgi:glycerol kinase